MKRLNLRQLDPCITDLESASAVRAILEKIEKCSKALERNLNLGDICRDPANYRSLLNTFGAENYEVAMQLMVRLILRNYASRSFNLRVPIEGEKKKSFIHRAVAGWRQFDTVMIVQDPNGAAGENYVILNPSKQDHWKQIKAIPAGSLITVYLKTIRDKRVAAQEDLALERYEAIFETLQVQGADVEPAPVIKLESRQAKPSPRPKIKPRSTYNFARHVAATNGPPVMSFKVVISKMDTFVHAGNAQLIISHIREFQGKVEMFVLRGEKKMVRLDADSIWGAEIRNGETVLFEFFGQQPEEAFLKELAKKVNKYTQMDKLA